MSNFTVFNLKLDRETLKRLTDQTKDSKARIVKDENNLVTLDLPDQRIKIEQSKRGSEMAVFYQRDTPSSTQLQLVGIPTCNTFARASKRTTTTPSIDKVKSHSNKEASPPTKPKKKSSTSSTSSTKNTSSNSPYVRPPPSPVKSDSTIDLPLEERLIHLLALCPHSINTLSKKLNSSALDVSQKIKKVAIPLKDVGTSSTKYILKPRLYSQIRIWDWPLYSSSERREVASNVEECYNLLRLPPDAPERQTLSQSTATAKKPSSSSSSSSSLIQPPSGKVNTQTERDRKIAAKKKMNDASPLYNNNNNNTTISQSRVIPATTTTITTITTPTSTPTSTQPNHHHHHSSNGSSTAGTPKITTTGAKGKGKIGHTSPSPVAPPPTTTATTNHHHTNNNNNNNHNNITPTSNKSHSLKPPTLNTTTSSSTGTTPITKALSNSPTTHHHASAPPTTSANTPIHHRSRAKSPNIFYKPKVSTHESTVSNSSSSSSSSKKRKGNNSNNDHNTIRKRQRLSYKRTDIHNQAEFDHLCKEYHQQHSNYTRDLNQFRSENPVYLKALESVAPQKSNREYAQRLRQSYDREDFAKMLQKTQAFFMTKEYVDGMWDNIVEFADSYKINPL
ncbi:hypothetical protein K501DRAFT_287280 [Backusella circina FSU 941]|nr:hypothetical protein K501DRAFT_287280 [Backusella circina FSU 941]